MGLRYNPITNRFEQKSATIDLSGYAHLSGATFTGDISATNLSGTNTGDQDLSGLLKLDQTTPQAITATDVNITATDEIYYGDVTDSTKLKKDTVQGILDLVPAPDLSGYVPYTGATADVNLGANNFTTTAGKVGVGTTAPSYQLHLKNGASDVFYVDDSISTNGLVIPASGSATVIESWEDGVYSAGYTHTIRIYPYKVFNGTRIYTDTYKELTVTDSASFTYFIIWDWDAVSGADGYRCLYYTDDPNYPSNYDNYYDTDTNSLFDFAAFSSGSTVTPTSYLSGTAFLGTTLDTAGYKLNGDTIIRSVLSNLGVGINVLSDNPNTTDNVGLGSNILTSTTGNGNVGIGIDTLSANTSGSGNIAMGFGAGKANTTGNSNVYMGNQAGAGNTTGNNNFYLGFLTGQLNQTGYSNVFIGEGSGQSCGTNAIRNVFIGSSVGSASTGNYNTFIGGIAMQGVANAYNYSTAIGYGSIVGASNTFAIGGTGTFAVDTIFGGTTASAKVHIIKTTEQLRVGYDASNYFNATVGSTGVVTFDAVGTAPEFIFSDTIKATGYKTGTETGITTTQTVISDTRMNSGQLQKKTQLLTFTNGLLTAQGAESDWTDTTDI
jgi:hypothetical protein